MEKATAVISDIHSNLEALEAVLADMQAQGISEIVCLGDIVGYASGVRACLRRIRELGCPVVMGNHDEAAYLGDPPLDFNETARAGAIFSAQCLKEEDLSWLRSLPLRLKIDGVEYFHASLETLVKWNYIISSSEARRHFSNQSSSLAFCGHTHQPVMWFQPTDEGHVSMNHGEGTKILPLNGKVLINVGAVGQPRDGDNRACYVIHRPGEKSVEFRRIPYDIARTKKKILRARLPRFSAQRLSLGR
jgi:diadenosine tetraphosphatase ApaH/serine/threonine PP2A family protein phosphatase